MGVGDGVADGVGVRVGVDGTVGTVVGVPITRGVEVALGGGKVGAGVGEFSCLYLSAHSLSRFFILPFSVLENERPDRRISSTVLFPILPLKPMRVFEPSTEQ